MKSAYFFPVWVFYLLLVFHSVYPGQSFAQQIWESDILLKATDRNISSRAVALDSLGHVHTVNTSEYIYYSWFDGENWLNETIIPPALPAWRASIGIGSGDVPHILFYGGGELVHAMRNGAIWEYVVLGEVAAAYACDLKFDSRGNPQTVFLSAEKNLVYAVRQEGIWNFSTIVSDVYPNSPWGFDLDSSDNPHVCYMDVNNDPRGLYYLHRRDSEWERERITPDLLSISHLQLLLDSDDQPRVVLLKQYRTTVEFWYLNDGVWFSHVLPDTDNWSGLTFFIDAVGVSHVVTQSAGCLSHFYGNGDHWDRETLDPQNQYKDDIAGIAGNANNLAIVGKNKTMSQIVCLERSDGHWSSDTLAEFGGYGNCSAAFDRNGDFNVLFTGQTGNQLIVGCKSNAGWTFQTLDSLMGADSGQCCIGIDENGMLHASYYNSKRGILYHAEKSDGIWNKEVVFEGSPVFDSEMVTYGDGNVAILLSTDEDLMLCRKAAGFWERDRLGSGSFRSVSICVDATGAYHCAYYRKTGGDFYKSELLYRYVDQGNWVEESIFSDNCGDGDEIVKLYTANVDEPRLFFGVYVVLNHGKHSEYIDFYSKVNGLWETMQFGSSVDVHEFSAYLNHSGFPCIASNGTLQLSTSTGEIMKSTYEGCCSSDEFRNSLLADDEGRFHLLRTTYYNLCYTRQITPHAGIRLEMPGHAFKKHETIYLNAYLRSTDEQVRTIPLCILLEYRQNYWFWPEWSNQVQVEYVDLNEKGSALLAIPSFSYREPLPQPLEGLTFWGALLNDDMTEIIGGVDGIGKWEFRIQ